MASASASSRSGVSGIRAARVRLTDKPFGHGRAAGHSPRKDLCANETDQHYRSTRLQNRSTLKGGFCYLTDPIRVLHLVAVRFDARWGVMRVREMMSPEGKVFLKSEWGPIGDDWPCLSFTKRLVSDVMNAEFLPDRDIFLYAGTQNPKTTRDPKHRHRLLSAIIPEPSKSGKSATWCRGHPWNNGATKSGPQRCPSFAPPISWTTLFQTHELLFLTPTGTSGSRRIEDMSCRWKELNGSQQWIWRSRKSNFSLARTSFPSNRYPRLWLSSDRISLSP